MFLSCCTGRATRRRGGSEKTFTGQTKYIYFLRFEGKHTRARARTHTKRTNARSEQLLCNAVALLAPLYGPPNRPEIIKPWSARRKGKKNLQKKRTAGGGRRYYSMLLYMVACTSGIWVQGQPKRFFQDRFNKRWRPLLPCVVKFYADVRDSDGWRARG